MTSTRPVPLVPDPVPTLSPPNDVDPQAVAEQLMTRYDDIVTELAADPVTASDPTSQVRSQWDELVATGSRLYADVLGLQVQERLTSGTRLVPGPEGTAYRHHVTKASLGTELSIDFSWCGYSPGVAVDARTGAVVDDAVARTSGIGRAVPRSEGEGSPWILEDLTYLEIDTMPAGSINPCT